MGSFVQGWARLVWVIVESCVRLVGVDDFDSGPKHPAVEVLRALSSLRQARLAYETAAERLEMAAGDVGRQAAGVEAEGPLRV